MDSIQKQNAHFGIRQEEFNLLMSMKSRIYEIIQLNIVTSLLVIVGAVARVLDLLCVPGINSSFYKIPSLIFNASNPLVYMFIMRDLRMHYLRFIRRRGRTATQNATVNSLALSQS